MIDFVFSFFQFVLATFVSLYLGMLCVLLAREVMHIDVRYLSAFALGLLFWFFLDTLNDGIQLDVNEGLSYGFQHIVLLSLFVTGFVFLAFVGGRLMSTRTAAEKSQRPLLVGILVAVGMGFHGIGEGLAFGGTSAGTSAVTILDAIGGYAGGAAYVLHKLLEATIVMIVYVSLTDDELGLGKKLSHLVILGLTFGLPSALGDVIGYFFAVDVSYLYAMGGGAALFVALLAVRPIFVEARSEFSYGQWVRVALALLFGFLALYAAASLHVG